MNTCLYCGKLVPQIEGKRERKFCDAKCRLRQWQKDQTELRKKVKELGLMPATQKPTAVDSKPVEELPVKTYNTYREDIKAAGSAAEIERIVRLSERDISLADWQKRQIKDFGVNTSRIFEF